MDLHYNKEQKTTIFVAIITSFVTTFTGSALNLAIPSIGQEMGASASLVGWIVTAYMLTVAALSVPFGRIADLTCRKRILVLGILIFSIGALASAFAWNMWIIVISRVVQGAGGAMIFSTNIAILISAFPGKDRGKVLGYSIASTYVGLSAGPAVGGMLNHYLGWRAIFIVTGIIGLGILIMAAIYLPKKVFDGDKKNYDILGNFYYIAMIVLTLYGFSDFSIDPVPITLVAIGIAMGVLFVIHELKENDPIIEVRIFRSNIAYSFSNLAALLNYGATFAIGYLVSIYLQIIMGYGSQTAGIILIIQPLLMAILSPFAGKLSDTISPFKLASFGMGLCAIGVFSFAFVAENTPIWVTLIILAVGGVGFAFFSSPNTNAVMACVEKKDYGVASSILATMRSMGHTSSMVIVTLIVGKYMGNSALADADPHILINIMHTSFLIFGAICAIGVFISLKRKNH
ncbi:MAG: MFS transporter [Anaerovoracaceae bacterium]